MNMKEATKRMKQDSSKMAALSGEQRNKALEAVRAALLEKKEEIFLANEEDMKAAEEAGIAPAVMKRLKFDEHKLEDVTAGIQELINCQILFQKFSWHANWTRDWNCIVCPVQLV